MGYQWSVSDRGIGDEFRTIAREQIGKAIDSAADDRVAPAKRIHETRRRCKKLRALLHLVRPDFDDFDDVNEIVRDAARLLSGARDARVTMQTLESLLRWADMEVPKLPAAEEDEDAERKVLAEFADIMRKLKADSGDWHVDDLRTASLADGFSETYRRGRTAARKAFLSLREDDFHQWRKQAKYHFNQLKLLERCAPDILAPAGELAGRLAEELGTHHDLAVLSATIAQGKLGVTLDDQHGVLAAAESWQRELEGEIGRLGRQIYVEAPRAIRQRFSAYLSLRHSTAETV